MTKAGLVFFSILVIAGCNSNDAKTHFSRTDKFGIKETGFLVDDTILTGPHNYYYPDGRIKCEENYIDGKLQGLRKTFYANTLIQQICRYENGLLNGWCFDYDENGHISSKSYSVNGQQAGDTYFYKPDGEIDQYLFLDYQQNKKKMIFYYERKKYFDSINESIFEDTIYNNRSDIVADSVSIGILISHPPATTNTLKVYELDSSGKVFDINNIDAINPYILFRKKIDKKLLIMRVVVDQYDSLANRKKVESHDILF